MSLKRAASTEGCSSGIGTSEIKCPKFEYYFVLEPEKGHLSDESSSESFLSQQQEETDPVKDTSDTSSNSDWSSEDDYMMKVEYEVASLSEKENPLGDGSLSSDTDDIVCVAAASVVNLCNEQFSSFADSSGDSDSNTLFDPEIPRTDYWSCLQCKNKNNNPLFRYCDKCYKRQICIQCNQSKKFPFFLHCDDCFKLRKNFFPPRPQRKRKRRRNSNKKSPFLKKSLSSASTVSVSKSDQENLDFKSVIAGPSTTHLDSESSSQLFSQESKSESLNKEVQFLEKSESIASTVCLSGQEDLDYRSLVAGPSTHLDSGLGSSQEMLSQDSKSEVDSQELTSNSTDSLNLDTCITCMTNPKNGIFVHEKVGHICCCYKCALKVWTQNGKCPTCNTKVSKVLKVIVQ